MSKLIKATTRICKTCKYHMAFGAQPGRIAVDENTKNIACNYLCIMGHSRIREKGVKMYDAEYCDKYEKGQKVDTRDTTLNLKRKEHTVHEVYVMERVRDSGNGRNI